MKSVPLQVGGVDSGGSCSCREHKCVGIVSVCASCHSVVSDPLQHHGLQPAKLLCSWNSSGKNTGVGRHSLLQGIFLTPLLLIQEL